MKHMCMMERMAIKKIRDKIDYRKEGVCGGRQGSLWDTLEMMKRNLFLGNWEEVETKVRM